MNFKFIESDQELARVCESLGREEIIGVDLEADSMHCFKEKICLIQIASPQGAFLVDPFIIKGMGPFVDVLGNPSIIKVFHGADFDVRSLDREYSARIANLFDTEIACRFLNVRERGLGALLKEHFNVYVDKRFQKQDWSRRPLNPEMIAYSVGDVAHLIDLYKTIRQRLEKAGRLDWAQEEFELQAGVRYECNHQPPLFKKFKGAGKLDNRSLAVLESLLRFRLEAAEKKDQPLFKIISNQSILTLTTLRPKNVEQMVTKGALSKKQAAMYGAQCQTAIEEALALPHKDLPSYPRVSTPRKTPVVQDRIKRLKKMREKQSVAIGMEPGFLINNASLTALAFDNPDSLEKLISIPGFRKWQVEALGDEILKTLGH
ncbi:ribonuclease D [Desulfospira joergensenii]|uniref:ribonuclease D n=1 Tax=Desulfospira joergensenii TaxID=53329 RepID=UPI0003B703E6|nr:ribonuclease D [Desulfospira joergensenii]